MAFNRDKDSLPAINPQQSTILGAAGLSFNQAKFNSSGIKSLSFSTTTTEKILHDTKPFNSSADEGSDSSGEEDDESTESDSTNDSTIRVEQVKPIRNKKNNLVNNVNDVRDDKAPPTINKKPHATNIISDFSNFEFHSKLKALGGRTGNENYAQSEISPRNKNNLSTVNSSRTKANNMTSVEEPSYNRSDIRSDVSWGSDPGQQPLPQVTKPTVKANPNFIIESQSFIPNATKSTPYYNTNTNEWNTKLTDSRSEIMYRGTDKVVSSRYNSVIRNPRFNPNSSPEIPKTMSDVTYQPKSARVPHSINESTSFYPGARVVDQQQHKPRVFVEPQRKIGSFAQFNEKDEEDDGNTIQNEEEKDEEIDEEIEELMNMTDDTNIQRKLLELQFSNKELLSLNKKLEEDIKEQSSRLENLSSFDSLLKTQKEQLEHITDLENIIKDLTTKLSEQETQIKKIKDGDEEEESKKVKLFYDPRNLPLHTLPRVIFDRVYDDVAILYSVVKSLLYTFYIFPMLIFFRVTRKVYERSKTKFVEITTE